MMIQDIADCLIWAQDNGQKFSFDKVRPSFGLDYQLIRLSIPCIIIMASSISIYLPKTAEVTLILAMNVILFFILVKRL